MITSGKSATTRRVELMGRRVFVLVVSVLILLITVPTGASAQGSVPDPDFFLMENPQVFPGTFGLHWENETVGNVSSYELTSNLPNFGTEDTIWQANSGATWNGSMWTVPASVLSVEVTIPIVAPGTQYTVSLNSCNSAGCSTANTATLTVTAAGYNGPTPQGQATWQTRWTAQDFSQLTSGPKVSGNLLDTAIGSDGTVWATQEFSSTLYKLVGGTFSSHTDTTFASSSPFAKCTNPDCTTFGSSSTSALAERLTVDANGVVWFTLGGWLLLPASAGVKNRSEVASFNPATHRFCSYQLPAQPNSQSSLFDNEIIGAATTGSGVDTTVWVVESTPHGQQGVGGYLDAFQPNLVNGNTCGSLQKSDQAYKLATDQLNEQIPLPLVPGIGGPAMLVLDPTTNQACPTFWISDYGATALEQVQTPGIGTGCPVSASTTVDTWSSANPWSRYYPPLDVTYGFAVPWEVATDGRYIYTIGYGDSQVVRFDAQNPTNPPVTLQLPVFSDTQEGYGLAVNNGRLYFTLADDGGKNTWTFGSFSTFGYVDLNSWNNTSTPQGVIYDDLAGRIDGPNFSDFRGIAVAPNGSVAIADFYNIVELSP
jgi:hypothetical protein